MKVLRKRALEVKNIKAGDQIIVQLTGFGEFTATAQKITEKGTLFLFDDCVTEQPMNNKNTNEGGYEKSDLCKWVNTILLKAFPKDMRNGISNLSIPTYGQMFGHDDWYDRVMAPDNDEQLPLMSKRKNRIADFNNTYEWYWLQNATKKEFSASHFANVYTSGLTFYATASASLGVRPAFVLAS